MVDYKAFQKLDVQILGIAPEPSFSQKTFAESLGFPFPLLSDLPDSRVIKLYSAGKWLPAGKKVPMVPGKSLTLKKPRTIGEQSFFLIDKKGILRGRWFPGVVTFPSDQILKMARRIANEP